MNGERVGVGGKNLWIIRGVKKEEEKKKLVGRNNFNRG